MSRPITFSTLILIFASILLLFPCFSVPITKLVSLGSLSGLRFDLAISLKPKYVSDFYFSFYKMPGLSGIFILHVIAAALAFVVFLLTLIAHLERFKKSGFFLIIILIFSFLAVISSMLSFLVDVLFFIPHLDWGSWCVLAASILNILVLGLVHLARKDLAVSREKEKKTSFSYHSQRRLEPNFVCANNLPRSNHIGVRSKQETKSRMGGDKSKLDPAKYPNSDTKSFISNLKKPELPPINIHFDDHHKASFKSFLDPTYCNVEPHCDSHFMDKNSNLTHKEMHKDNNGIYDSYSRHDDTFHERMATEDHLKDHTKYYPREQTREQSREHPREHPRDHSKEHLRDHSKEHLRGHPKEHLRGHPKEHLRDHLRDHPRDHLRDHPRDHLRDHPRDHLRDHPRDHLRKHSREHLGEFPRNFPREYSRENSRCHSADILRDLSRNPSEHHLRNYPRSHSKYYSTGAPREHLGEPPRHFQREHSGQPPMHFQKEHLREHLLSQSHSRQNSNHKTVQYPMSKPHISLGIVHEGDSKQTYDSFEKGKLSNDYNNSYDEYISPRETWKNCPFSQNGYTFSEESAGGKSSSFLDYKAGISDKPHENNTLGDGFVVRNHTSHAPQPYYKDNDYRFSENMHLSHSADWNSRAHQNYRSNNFVQTQDSSWMKSPAASISSHFTSISQRGINPNWVPPNKEQMYRPENSKQDAAGVTSANNLDFEGSKNPHKSTGIAGSASTCRIPLGLVSNTEKNVER
ncbi:hypothetical protein PCANB_002256 [Pneumocystis canis]|nr:hypothetical protein PCANB_002256 [Pneumocystis canis]